MRKTLQLFLLVCAIGVLLITAVAYYQIVLASSIHGTPVRFINTTAGPYQLRLALYNDPLPAGDALPFNIAAIGTQEPLTYTVTATPNAGVAGSVAQGDVNMQQNTPYGVPGSISLVTRGDWTLHIVVNGPAGQGEATVPVTAVAPPAIPVWLAWIIGLLPLAGLVILWSMQWRQKQKSSQIVVAQ